MKTIEFEKCGYMSHCWVNRGRWHIPRHRLPVWVPLTAKRLWAVLLRRGTKETFIIHGNGQVEGFSLYCYEWREYVRSFYDKGYRAVRFEYEE